MCIIAAIVISCVAFIDIITSPPISTESRKAKAFVIAKAISTHCMMAAVVLVELAFVLIIACHSIAMVPRKTITLI